MNCCRHKNYRWSEVLNVICTTALFFTTIQIREHPLTELHASSSASCVRHMPLFLIFWLLFWKSKLRSGTSMIFSLLRDGGSPSTLLLSSSSWCSNQSSCREEKVPPSSRRFRLFSKLLVAFMLCLSPNVLLRWSISHSHLTGCMHNLLHHALLQGALTYPGNKQASA